MSTAVLSCINPRYNIETIMAVPLAGRVRGSPPERNSEFTKCHYHAPDPEPWVTVQAQKTHCACADALMGLPIESSPGIGAVLWNSK